MGVLTLNKIYPDRSNALKMRTRITITGLFLLAVAAALLNIEQQSSLAFAAREEDKDVLYVCKEDTTTDVFEFVSGIFAAILFVLSLRAYRNLKIKSILYVSAAFGIFAARTIAIETRDLIFGGGTPSGLQSSLSIMFLMAIVLFFIAILQRQKIKPKPPQPDI
jgi:hypothetical protein